MRHADNAQETESEYLHFLLMTISALLQQKWKENTWMRKKMTMQKKKKMKKGIKR